MIEGFLAPSIVAARGRPRLYAFAELHLGDILSVALNGRDEWRLRQTLTNAARHWRDTGEPGFDWTIRSSPGFLHVERVPDCFDCIEDHRRYLDFRTTVWLGQQARTRRLTPAENARLHHAHARQRRRDAVAA